MAVTSKNIPGSTSKGEEEGAAGYSQGLAPGGAYSLGSSAYAGRTVFFGATGTEFETGGRRAEGVRALGQPIWMTPEEAYGDFYKWDDKQRQELVVSGIVSGQLKENAGMVEAAAWWKELVQEAARYGASGKPVSPMSLAMGYVNGAGLGMTDQQRQKLQPGAFPAGAIFDSSGKYTGTYKSGEFIVNQLTGERSYVGPQFKTTTQTRTDMTDPMTAKALTTSVFQQLVGRDPGPGELNKFAAALAEAERSSPVTENVTSQYDTQGNVVATNSTQTGGLTAAAREQMMKDQLKQTKEYGVQQAVTTFAEATRRAIWGGPGS